MVDLAACVQFAAFFHISKKLEKAINYCHRSKIPISAVNVVGGVANNQTLIEIVKTTVENKEDKMPLFVNYAPPSSGLNTDNGAMIAWAGWELINAE